MVRPDILFKISYQGRALQRRTSLFMSGGKEKGYLKDYGLRIQEIITHFEFSFEYSTVIAIAGIIGCMNRVLLGYC